MGYYTDYTVEVMVDINPMVVEGVRAICSLETLREIAQSMSLENTAWHLNNAIDNGSGCTHGKWYDHEKHLKDITRNLPGVVIKVSGTGEEDDDIWQKYFSEGKMQRCQAVISFAPYDPSKLE